MSLLVALVSTSLWIDLPAHDEAPTFDRVNLSAGAFELAASDTLVAVLSVQAEGARQADVADDVNQAMGWAVQRARSAPEVKLETLRYRVTPVYRLSSRSDWRPRQPLRTCRR